MPKDKKDLIIRKIEEIEQQLRNIKLELRNYSDSDNDSEKNSRERSFRIGEEVIIVNPKRGQASSGTLIKIHKRTGRGSVLTKNNKGQDVEIVRLLRNLKSVEK